jgi:hypothetical protein
VRVPCRTRTDRGKLFCAHCGQNRVEGQVFVKVICSDAVTSLPEQINRLIRICGYEESHVEAEHVTDNATSFKTT